MVRQILLVTEGVSEGDLLKKLFKRFCSEKVEIVEFKTNIYQLYDCYESYHCRYDQLDLRKVLLEHCTRLKSSEKERLKKNFSEIYLIFDMDPQDPLYSREKLIKLHSHFQTLLITASSTSTTQWLRAFITSKRMLSRRHF